MANIAILSFRLRQTDGVSIVAKHWETCLQNLGHTVTTIAGEGPVDKKVPWLALDTSTMPTKTEVRELLQPFDVILAENILTIPLRPLLTQQLAEAMHDLNVIVHHHDPAWHRERFHEFHNFLFDSPRWLHVTITALTQEEYRQRGLETTLIYNGFTEPVHHMPRDLIRKQYDFSLNERLFTHPVRAIERKNIPEALALCKRHHAHYWLGGPAEEGYGPTLQTLLNSTSVSYSRQSAQHVSDLYDGADMVLFPSTWEGFGNPPIEAGLYRRPVIVGDYPVATELKTFGFAWFSPGETSAIETFLDNPDTNLLDHNEFLARKHFSLERLELDIHNLLQHILPKAI